MARPSRIEFLDVLKGVAILLMIQVHCYGWWLEEPLRSQLFFAISVTLGWFAAPIFLFALGCGVVISLERRLGRGETERAVAIHILSRACGLFLGGYVLNFVTFGGTPRSDLQSVSVLSCIGLCVVGSYVAARWLPRFAAAVLALVCVILTPVLRQSTLLHDTVLQPWLVNIPFQSNYSLFPWCAFALLGVEVGKHFFLTSELPHKMAAQFRVLFLVGTSLVCLWGTRVFEYELIMPQDQLSTAMRMQALFWYPSISFCLFHGGVVFIEFATIGWLLQLHSWRGRLRRPLSLFGRSALLLFVGHHLIGYRLVHSLAGMDGMYGTMSVRDATICLCFMLGACWGAAEICVHRCRRTHKDR